MAFLKKEFRAIFKTYRVWVIPLVFITFALMSPPLAKLTPKLIESVLPKGINMKVPDPKLTDAFAQWFKNLSQIGVLAVILLTMGLVAEEKSSGTILLIVTKPISRANVVLSKFIAQAAWLTLSFTVSAAACYGYAAIIFTPEKAAEFIQGNIPYLIYFVLVVAVTVFFSTVLKSQVAAGGLTLVTVMLMSLLPALGDWGKNFTPGGLTYLGDKIAISGTAQLADGLWLMIIACVLMISLLTAAIIIFNHQEL
jgi:ABC-2 type transport system permease protein